MTLPTTTNTATATAHSTNATNGCAADVSGGMVGVDAKHVDTGGLIDECANIGIGIDGGDSFVKSLIGGCLGDDDDDDDDDDDVENAACGGTSQMAMGRPSALSVGAVAAAPSAAARNLHMDDSDMFGPPRVGYHHHRSRVPMITPKLRLREERKRILQLCARKLERIKDSEANLCRSVCINNTYCRLTDEVRREKQSRYLANLPKSEIAPETAHENIFNPYNNNCNIEGSSSNQHHQQLSNKLSSTVSHYQQQQQQHDSAINVNNSNSSSLRSSMSNMDYQLQQQQQQQQHQQQSNRHSQSHINSCSSNIAAAISTISTNATNSLSAPSLSSSSSASSSLSYSSSSSSSLYSSCSSVSASSSSSSSSSMQTTSATFSTNTHQNNYTSSSASAAVTTTLSSTSRKRHLSSNNLDKDLEILDRELNAINAPMPLIDPEITQGAEQLEKAMISSRKRLRSEEESDRLVREALSQFYIPQQRLISAIEDCPIDVVGGVSYIGCGVMQSNNSFMYMSNGISSSGFGAVVGGSGYGGFGIGGAAVVGGVGSSVAGSGGMASKRMKLMNGGCGSSGASAYGVSQDLVDLDFDINNHQTQKEFEVIMDALRLGTPSPTPSMGSDSCGQAAMMSESVSASVYHNLVVTSLET